MSKKETLSKAELQKMTAWIFPSRTRKQKRAKEKY